MYLTQGQSGVQKVTHLSYLELASEYILKLAKHSLQVKLQSLYETVRLEEAICIFSKLFQRTE